MHIFAIVISTRLLVILISRIIFGKWRLMGGPRLRDASHPSPIGLRNVEIFALVAVGTGSLMIHFFQVVLHSSVQRISNVIEVSLLFYSSLLSTLPNNIRVSPIVASARVLLPLAPIPGRRLVLGRIVLRSLRVPLEQYSLVTPVLVAADGSVRLLLFRIN